MRDKYEYADPASRHTGTNPKIVKPYLTRNMTRPRLHGKDNLCSTIRDIYVKTDDEQIKFWCRIAMRMSKNMYQALKRYKDLMKEAGIDVENKEVKGRWQR